MDNRFSEIAVPAAVWASTHEGIDQLWLAVDRCPGGLAESAGEAQRLYAVVVTGGAHGTTSPRVVVNTKVLDDWQRALGKLVGRSVIVSVFGVVRLGADVPEAAMADGICVFSRSVLSGGTLPKNITEAAKALRDVFPHAFPSEGSIAARAS